MFKIMSSEEYEKLTRGIDYWKMRTLEEKAYWQRIHENKVSDIIKENKSLRCKVKELEKDKVTFISLGEVKDLNKAKKMAEEIIKEINNEHQCNRHCFTEHILPAIQSDYDECNYNSHLIQHKFIEYWSEKLSNEYDFVNCICLMNGKIAVKYN